MSTITEKLDRLETYKSDIKAAIIDKGQDVSDNMAEYAAAIEQISGGGDDKDYSKNPDLGKKVLNTYNTFTASDGTMYVGGNQQAYSPNNYLYGIYIIKDGVATQIILNNIDGWSCFFEGSDGTVYASSGKSNTGLYAIKDGVATQVITSGNYWQYFLEASDGTIYISCDYTYTVYAVKDGVVLFSIPNNSQLNYLFEASDGTLYFNRGGYSSSGVYAVKDGVATWIIKKGNKWINFLEASDGTVYVGSSGSTVGVYAIKDGVATQIDNITDYDWQYFFEGSDGTVYVSSNNNNTGLYAIKDGVATKVITSGYSWRYFFEGSDGTVYVGGNNNSGLYAIKDGVATQVITSGNYWQYFIEQNGKVYVSSKESNNIYNITPNSYAICLGSNSDKWQLYNGVYISTDTEHKYQYDLETQTKIDRIIQLPKSRHYFLSAASQVVTDAI